MRAFPAFAVALATAALAAGSHVAPASEGGAVSAWALFSFAVAAFRAPPR